MNTKGFWLRSWLSFSFSFHNKQHPRKTSFLNSSLSIIFLVDDRTLCVMGNTPTKPIATAEANVKLKTDETDNSVNFTNPNDNNAGLSLLRENDTEPKRAVIRRVTELLTSEERWNKLTQVLDSSVLWRSFGSHHLVNCTKLFLDKCEKNRDVRFSPSSEIISRLSRTFQLRRSTQYPNHYSRILSSTETFSLLLSPTQDIQKKDRQLSSLCIHHRKNLPQNKILHQPNQ